MLVLNNKAGYQAGLIEVLREYFGALGLNEINYDELGKVLMDGQLRRDLKRFAKLEGKWDGSISNLRLIGNKNEFCPDPTGPTFGVNLARMMDKVCIGIQKESPRFDTNIYHCAMLCLSTLNSAFAAAKKHKRTLVVSGRDGFLFFLGAKILGMECVFLPGWSSNTYIKYPYEQIRDLGIDPYFVDTGYKGSLFVQYEKHRIAEEKKEYNAKFVLISCNRGSRAGKDGQSRLAAYSLQTNIPTSTKSYYEIDGKASAACGFAETIEHPVESGNDRGWNENYTDSWGDGYNLYERTIKSHLSRVIVLYSLMTYLVNNKKGWR